MNKEDPTILAWKISAYIDKQPGDVTYTELMQRATAKRIDPDTVDIALSKMKKIDKRVVGGQIVYRSVRAKKVTFGSHLTWLRNNYPAMDGTNDGSGIEANYDYLFMSPEEFEKYKAEVQGRAYIPSKRYQKKQASLWGN